MRWTQWKPYFRRAHYRVRPKIRACEIIEEIEKEPRGIYGGALGYIDFSGNLDTCIAIRMAVRENDRVYVQAGGRHCRRQHAGIGIRGGRKQGKGRDERDHPCKRGGRRMILLIDNYDSFTYNLLHLAAGIKPDVQVVRNDALTVREIQKMRPSHMHTLARARVSEGRGYLRRGRAKSRRTDSDTRCLPWPPGHLRGVRRKDRACAAPDAWQKKQDTNSECGSDIQGSA